MKLGDKVQFSKHYKKTRNYLDPGDEAEWTDEQKWSWETNECADIERFAVVEHLPMTGIIAGKRNIAVTKTIRLKPSINDIDDIEATNTIQQVYLVAVNMSGFYRVRAEWIERAGDTL